MSGHQAAMAGGPTGSDASAAAAVASQSAVTASQAFEIVA